jgi:hypothetical protein
VYGGEAVNESDKKLVTKWLDEEWEDFTESGHYRLCVLVAEALEEGK